MLIYLIMILPLIAVIFLSWKFPKKVTIWERAVVLIVPIICIVISKMVSVHSQTKDTEYWNSYGMNAVYYEYWDEWIKKECCAQTDTSGNCISWYDCSYCEEHPAYWEITDNIGVTHRYGKHQFEQAAKMWNSRQFKNMNRDYHQIDGDAYIATYDSEFEHTIPICKQHVYENRIQCSKSVFNFEDVDTSEIRIYNLHRYPNYEQMGIFHYNPIIGATNGKASRKLSFHNAHLGANKKVHMMMIVYEDQPIQAAMKQEAHWKKGNKNEFILCIGRKGKETKWAYVISWTDVEILKVRVARKAKEMEYDLVNIVDMMATEVNKEYVRKKFADFSYISVEPTMTAVMITFFITLLVTVGISLFVVLNNFTRDTPGSLRRFR